MGIEDLYPFEIQSLNERLKLWILPDLRFLSQGSEFFKLRILICYKKILKNFGRLPKFILGIFTNTRNICHIHGIYISGIGDF